jgi:Protein of unknown function (DUF4199)
MKRIVWTFGLISGGVLSVLMLVSMFFIDQIGDKGEILGYTTMVVAFLMVYFGIRSYRDDALGGVISFGKAFQAGILITVIACVCYVGTWEILFFKGPNDFGVKFSAKMIEKAKEPSATQQQTDAKIAQMKKFMALYQNPFINSAMTFIEPFPVGLAITLVCAGILKRRTRIVRSSASSSVVHSGV